MVIWVQFSHTDHWMLNMAPHGKELSEDLRIRIVALHKDGRGYKKFGNNLELSYSTVARVIQRFSKTGFTRNRPRKGRSKKLSPCAVRQVQKLASKNRHMSAASIALEVAEVEGQLVSAQTIHHTLQQVGLHGRSLFWSWLTKKPANSLLKTTWPRAWITWTMSCGLMRLMPSSHCTIFKLVGSPLFSHCMTIWGRIQPLLFSHCTMDPRQGVSHCTISQ